jgi:hypothetical protein
MWGASHYKPERKALRVLRTGLLVRILMTLDLQLPASRRVRKDVLATQSTLRTMEAQTDY